MEYNRSVTTLEKFRKQQICSSPIQISTIINKRIAVRVTNATESPYLIKKNTEIAELSVVIPKQSKNIKPIEMAILSVTPQGGPELPAYSNELLRTNNIEQQNNTFRFPKPQNPGSHPITYTNPQKTH